MASILSWNNSINQQLPPKQTIEGVIQQILNSQDSIQEFSKIVNSSPEAQNVMNIVKQYGNGDFRAGFMNYASAMGKQALAQQILQDWGLS